MLELLAAELSAAGLSINGGKTKILTTNDQAVSGQSPVLVDAADMFVEIVRRDGCHKYLGKVLSGDLRARGQRNLEHRISLSWGKFHALHTVLTNQNVPVHLRLRLFDSVVSPTATYSLNTTPLTVSQLNRLDATQRRMMRRIVGWVRCDEDTWETTGRRMKHRLETALARCPVHTWSEVRDRNRTRLLNKISSGQGPKWAMIAHCWQPSRTDNSAYRLRGRPAQRWC